MIGIGRLIYKATGVMSHRGIVKNCEKIGRTLAGDIRAGGRIETGRVHELLSEAIGSKKAAKVTIASDFDTFKAFAKDNLKLTDEIAERLYNGSVSAVIPGGKSGKTLLNLRLENADNLEALNLTTHELEHVLWGNVSMSAKKRQFIMKLIPQEVLEYLQKSLSNTGNKKLHAFQNWLIQQSKLGPVSSRLKDCTEYKPGLEGLLKQTGFESREKLHDAIRTFVRQELIFPGIDERNPAFLKLFRKNIRDEARAYNVGGRVVRNFVKGENISKSEMLAQLYNEAAIVLKSEIKIRKRIN